MPVRSARIVWSLVAIAAPAWAGSDAVAASKAAACVGCLPSVGNSWHAGRHSRMLQAATAESVVGDFARGSLSLRGLPYRLEAKDGAFFVTERYLTGAPQRHRIDFTLGSRRIQLYLTSLEDGRISRIFAVRNPGKLTRLQEAVRLSRTG